MPSVCAMGVYLPQRALPGLKKYKYASEDRSLVSRYILKPFYTHLIEYFPTWMAPNLITLLGLFFSVGSFLRAWYFNSDFTSLETPRWVFFTYAVDLFIYQTLDALDGQQARRTGSSSPLGELFDHCVDAINTSLQAYVFSSVINLPKELVVVTQFLCTLNFYLSTWEEYYTHKLFLSFFSGPVEGILLCVGFEVLTGIKGPQIWDVEALGKLTLRDVVSAASSFGLAANTWAAVDNVRKLGGPFRQRLLGSGPFVSMWVGFGLWAALAWPELSRAGFLPFYLTVALTFALLVGRIITAHVTNQKFPMWNPLIAVPYVGIIFNLLVPSVSASDVALVTAGIAFGVYGSFVGEVITEITTYLDIGCLYSKHKPKQA